MEATRDELSKATKKGTIIDFDVTHTGDDICLLMMHRNGSTSAVIHDLAWKIFQIGTDIAR